MDDVDRASMLKYRKEHFEVEVRNARDTSYIGAGEIILSVTHNGHHWSSLSLLPNEARCVINALEQKLLIPLDNGKKEKP